MADKQKTDKQKIQQLIKELNRYKNAPVQPATRIAGIPVDWSKEIKKAKQWHQ